jgi:hypothetical protein
VLGQGESVFRLRNFNIVGFYYLFNCATCFGYTTIFGCTYFPRTYSIDNGSVVFFFNILKYVYLEDGRMTETCSAVK